MLNFNLIFASILSLNILFCSSHGSSQSIGNAGRILDSDEGSHEMDVFEEIIETNKHFHMLDHLYEGDIMPEVFRNAHGNKWPKSNEGFVWIPYTLSEDYNSANRLVIQSAIKRFDNHTCIRFVPRENETKYLSIENATGCWSFVGRIKRDKQRLSLGIPGCMAIGIAMHELMHAIGFTHEQSRSDRDNYVQVLLENIQDDREPNFNKRNTQNLVVYDYTSLMHYSMFTFAEYRYLPSLQVFPNSYPSPKLGSNQMSAYDIEEIKYYYDCEPDTYIRCGREFFHQDNGTFNSPNHPGNYPEEAHCTWNITVRENGVVRLTLWSAIIENSNFCQLDSVIIHDGNNANATVLARICGRKPVVEVTSSGNQMFVIFTSDVSREYEGFRASFDRLDLNERPFLITPHVSNGSNLDSEFRCDFDKDMCGMIQDETNDLSFRLRKGKTPSSDTGPSFDHTSGEGNYLYLEASSVTFGSNAIVRTPWMSISIVYGNSLCIEFSYHMYGQSMGGLRLLALERINNAVDKNSRILWGRYADQGDEWHTDRIQYDQVASSFGFPEVDVQFYWEGYIARHTSDMAIDDVIITQGKCNSKKNTEC